VPVDRSTALSLITEKVRDIAAPARSLVVGETTEIYIDLRISGDDLYILLRWIQDQFGVCVLIRPWDHAPREVNFVFWTSWLKRRRGGYKSLTVGDLVDAVVGQQVASGPSAGISHQRPS
jgi:hypothetical protein